MTIRTANDRLAPNDTGDGHAGGTTLEDFDAWTRDQAAASRRLADQRWNGPLDFLHLGEEVQDLGREQQWAVKASSSA
jgi:hypothetical protein